MITVREAKDTEAERLAQIGLAAWNNSIARIVPNSTAAEINRNNPFSAFTKAMGSKIAVAAMGEELIGFAARENGGRVITDLWVAPEDEGRGAGTALITHVERLILLEGFSIAEIEVARQNTRAFSLYQHLGYSIIWLGTKHDDILGIDLEKCRLSKAL